MIGFAGLSHLGLVSSVAAASKGFEVVAHDPDALLCDALDDGRLPVAEPELPELLAANRPRVRFTADGSALAACDVVFVSIDVPTDAQNRADVSPVERLIKQVAAVASDAATLVVLSQVPPGFTRRLQGTLAPRIGAPHLFCQVETLVFGRAVERALTPERIIVGCADPAAPLPPVYASFLQAFGCPILPMRYESAELAKISINMFLVSAISVTNTLAELCEAVGAGWSEIAPALRLDRRIGPYAYLAPGLGIAGGNLERDLTAVSDLARLVGTDAGIVDAWVANSQHRREWALEILHAQALSRRRDPVIAVWGLAYKPDTASTKNSPALGLLEALRELPVRVYDPTVRMDGDQSCRATRAGSALDACQGADALAVMTPWREFSDIDPAEIRRRMRGQVIVDPFGALDGERCAALGLEYFRLGEPARRSAPVQC